MEKSCAVSSAHLPEVISRDAAVCQGEAPMHEAEKEQPEPRCESSFVSPQKFLQDTLKLTDWCRVSRLDSGCYFQNFKGRSDLILQSCVSEA